jgi:hypothetical protein
VKRFGTWKPLTHQLGKAAASAGVAGLLGLGAVLLAPAVSAHTIPSITQDCNANPPNVAVTLSDWSDPNSYIQITGVTNPGFSYDYPVPGATTGTQVVDVPISDLDGNGEYTFGRENYPTDPIPSDFTLSCGTPNIYTNASPSSAPAGANDTIGDTATFYNLGVSPPTGSVSFALYSDSGCTDAVNGVGGSAPIVDNLGTYSATYTTTWDPSLTATYYWLATYSGDSNNYPANTSCQACNEELSVDPASPTITTELASSTADVGGSAQDTARLSGASSAATGAITIELFSGSTASACSGTPLATEATTPATAGNGSYTATFTKLAAGSYELEAFFAQDPDDNSANSGCGSELLVVSTPVGGQLAASTGTPITGADLAGPGLAGILASLLGGALIFAGVRLRRDGSLV